MYKGYYIMDNEQWTRNNGQWIMHHESWIMYNGQSTKNAMHTE